MSLLHKVEPDLLFDDFDPSFSQSKPVIVEAGQPASKSKILQKRRWESGKI
jgi:hypothetical protein